MGNKSFLGKGSIYFEEIGGTTGLLPVGNAKDLVLNFNEDKKEQKDYEDAGGAVVNTVSRIDSVTGSVVLLELTKTNLQKALRALVNVVAAGAVVSEPHAKGYHGAMLPFNKVADMSQAIVITSAAAATTYTEGTDYTLGKNGIIILSTGTMVDAAAVEVSYAGVESFNIEGLADSGKEYKMYFDGLNEADSGNPVPVTLHRVKINPAQALSLITDDFGELAVTFDILKDSSIVGAGLSKFLSMSMVA